jgi:hypothetical protein
MNLEGTINRLGVWGQSYFMHFTHIGKWGDGGVRVKCLNEKILFLQVWWGRIASQILFWISTPQNGFTRSNANYENIIMPCDEKMKKQIIETA